MLGCGSTSHETKLQHSHPGNSAFPSYTHRLARTENRHRDRSRELGTFVIEMLRRVGSENFNYQMERPVDMPHYLKDVPELRHVQVTDRAEVYQGAISNMFVDTVEFSGETGPVQREWLQRHDSVGILAVRGETSNPEALLIRQYRHPVRSMLWEIPAGMLDISGESPEQAARRELEEETDLTADHFEHLVTFYPHLELRPNA